MKTTATEIHAAMELMATAVGAIRDAGSMPSGHLYAAMSNHLTMGGYEAMLRQILRTGLVRQHGDVLDWVG